MTVRLIIAVEWVMEVRGPGKGRPREGGPGGKDREVRLEGSNEGPDFAWGVVSSGS